MNGLASYVGVKLDVPTIGVAKNLLLGELGLREDEMAPIIDDGETIGAAVWSGKRKSPIYVSIGHKISLDTAIEIVKSCSIYRIPEPLRCAHICASNERDGN